MNERELLHLLEEMLKSGKVRCLYHEDHIVALTTGSDKDDSRELIALDIQMDDLELCDVYENFWLQRR